MRIQKSGAKRQKQGCSVVMTVSWVIIVGWLIFLFYCWRSGHLHTAKIPPNYVNKLNGMLDKVDTSLRGATHDLVHLGIPHASISTPPVAEPVPIVPAVEPYDIHVVFSTDCTPYQDYQTIVLFHSASVVGQKGPVTRIASGCTDEQKATLTNLYKKLYPQYHVHFTPDFKKDDKSGQSYAFYNKPWGMKHWLENAVPAIPDGVAVALLDPDMILVRPLTPQMRNQPNNLYNKAEYKTPDDIMERVVAGKPAAQLYGLTAPWANDNHKRFNRTHICGADSPCREPEQHYAEEHYAVGPPYIAVKEDMIKIANTWTKFVPRVYEGYPYLLAEMYAYSMAAAHERLPHVQFEHFMVSNTDAGGEGWPLIDNLPNACAPPVDGIYLPGTPLPLVVHYCQNFRAGGLGFAKRQVHMGKYPLFSCEHDLFVEPPVDLDLVDYFVPATATVKSTEKTKLNKLQAKRNGYALCVIHRSMNAAMIDYKTRMCGGNNATSYEKKYIAMPAYV
jgi:hypothetical protein